MTSRTGATYPTTRLRRNRRTTWLRDLLREHRLSPDRLILPVLLREDAMPRHIQGLAPSMTGLERHTIDELEELAKNAIDKGIRALMLFPTVTAQKRDEKASAAFDPDNLICRAVRRLCRSKSARNIGIICDVALDPYTSHGHDGIIHNGEVANDESVAALCRQALVLADAGCDIVAPSDMMDGRVGAIRKALDHGTESGGVYPNVAICSYAAKYASHFYQPFREALETQTILDGDKSGYQMDPANGDEAMREIRLDINEGADMIMVKPGLPYLDVIARAARKFPVPVLGYHVSGEYAMLRALADSGSLDYAGALIESLTAFIRAGARAVVSYGALDAARILNDAHG